MLWIVWNSIYWAKQLALWLIMMSNAFGTQIWIDLINQLAHINGFIWAYRFANITIDAFICNK